MNNNFNTEIVIRKNFHYDIHENRITTKPFNMMESKFYYNTTRITRDTRYTPLAKA